MNAMMDATCPACGRRFGWAGAVTDRPPCPRCGHQVPREQLEAEQARMNEILRLCDLHPRDATPQELANQRRMAGLSRGQAARQVGVPVAVLSGWEEGLSKPDPRQSNALAECYGCG